MLSIHVSPLEVQLTFTKNVATFVSGISPRLADSRLYDIASEDNVSHIKFLSNIAHILEGLCI